MRIFHVITGLDIGGAELMLKRLIDSSPDSINNTTVVSLTTLGIVGEYLRLRGVTIFVLNISSIWSAIFALLRLIKIIRDKRPDIVQTWMYHANLLGGIAARFAGNRNIIWNLRATSIPQGRFSVTYWLVRLSAFFSYFIPKKIVCCANSAINAHLKLNYSSRKMIFIPNGYDFSVFILSPEIRKTTRFNLGCSDSDILIGVVGRFDALKDFNNFILSASIVALMKSNVKFLMVGRGNDWANKLLFKWINDLGLIEKFILVGQQQDVNPFLSAMDIFCLSSMNEAFPNVVVEAMAVGLPCVVTSAGDAAEILEDADYVVPIRNSELLAKALIRMCDLDVTARQGLGKVNYLKARSKYDINLVGKMYKNLYNEVLSQS